MGALWHPSAVRRIHIDAGGFQDGARKLVWHTTETHDLPNYGGSAPHFTLDPATGRLWQHIPLNRAARALKPGGPNFWNTVQVEVMGFAKDSQAWSNLRYRRVAKLARWIEANFGVPRRVGVTFKGNGATPHLASLEAFRQYPGHIGHQHVPGNDHWDPGMLKIDLVLHPPPGGGS
jgi:N-acetylmuramoyl-L-alanine amidase